jgi:hypothetical protein
MLIVFTLYPAHAKIIIFPKRMVANTIGVCIWEVQPQDAKSTGDIAKPIDS